MGAKKLLAVFSTASTAFGLAGVLAVAAAPAEPPRNAGYDLLIDSGTPLPDTLQNRQLLINGVLAATTTGDEKEGQRLPPAVTGVIEDLAAPATDFTCAREALAGYLQQEAEERKNTELLSAMIGAAGLDSESRAEDAARSFALTGTVDWQELSSVQATMAGVYLEGFSELIGAVDRNGQLERLGQLRNTTLICSSPV